MSERDEQQALFDYAAWMANQDARWRLLVAVPNGQYRRGQRPEPGLQAGFPDVLLCCPNAHHCGLAVEMKHGRGRTTPAQREWLDRLATAGWRCVVAYSAGEAIAAVQDYLRDDERWLKYCEG